jgi:rhodanese-related sulfurtransferase
MLPAELNRLLEREDAVVVVDVRSPAAYERAHVSGAALIPLAGLQERIGELNRDVTVVLYDLSLQRHVSLKAAMLLYESGFTKVLALDGGFSRWYAEGYPIEGTLLTPTPERADPPWTVTPLPTSTLLSQTPSVVPTTTESK